MKKQQLQPRKIHTYEMGLNEWQRRMKTICAFANEVGYQYQLLEVGEFSDEILLKLTENFLWERVNEKLKAENIPASLASLAREQYTQQIKYVLRALDGLQKEILKGCQDSRHIAHVESLGMDNIPFNGDHAEITPESLKAIEERYFTNVIQTPFELDLYSKVEAARDAINDVLKTSREQIRVYDITDFLQFDNVTGEVEIKSGEFGDFRYI